MQRDSFAISFRLRKETFEMDEGYITMREKEILTLQRKGILIESIAKRYNLSLEEVREISMQALKKIENLQTDEISWDYPFICKDIDNFINRMGMNPLREDDIKLLKSALLLTKEQPNLLNNMLKGFYIKLSIIHGKSISTIQLKLRNIYRHSLDQKQCESQLFLKQYFPQKYKMKNSRGIQMSKLLLSSLECIDCNAYYLMSPTCFKDEETD